MIEFKPCRFEHIKYIEPSSVGTEDYAAFLSPEAEAVVERHFSLSAWDGQRCVGAAGVADLWAGRSEAWCLFGAGAAPHMAALIRKMRWVVAVHPARRLEMVVVDGNATGHKLARLVGMDAGDAVRLKSYTPDGRDVTMYARIR